MNLKLNSMHILILCISLLFIFNFTEGTSTLSVSKNIHIPNQRLVYEKPETQIIAEDDQASFLIVLKPSEHGAGKVTIRMDVCKGKVSSIMNGKNAEEDVVEDGYIYHYYEWNGKKEETLSIIVKSHDGPAKITIVWTMTSKYDPIQLYRNDEDQKTISYLEGDSKNITIMWQVPIVSSNAYQYFIYKKLRSNNCPMVKPTACKIIDCGAEIIADSNVNYDEVPPEKIPSNSEPGIGWLQFEFTPVAPYENVENYNFYIVVYINRQEAVYPSVTPLNSSNLIFYIILFGVIVVLCVGFLVVILILILLIIREVRARKRAKKRKSNLDNLMSSSKKKTPKNKFITKFVHSRKESKSNERDALIDRTLLSKFGSND
mmetsp:Transcript_3437/g.5065  ORF Transcript_3437/g.5065 Transcript_3437/m.5065 type:complete len:374 (+) Transcript_3437:131-1252(+)